jgi:hypothetical protein
MNYKVTIEATLRKELTIDASNEQNAIDLANEEFDLRNDHNPEKYDQQTISVVPVRARSSITSVTVTDFATGQTPEEK